ncbi:MAG: hypothetical protein JNK48_19070 [Bryobacterales bacterium]|nr:hypothetical protein [Bryobacterales bacterium]
MKGALLLPESIKPRPGTIEVVLPESGSSIAPLLPVQPLLGLGGKNARTAPRRRFQYGWSARSTIRFMLSRSVARLRYLESYNPMDDCPPVTPHMAVQPVYAAAPRERSLRMLRPGLDETAVAAIPPQSPVLSTRDALHVAAPGVVCGLAPVAPVWVRTEKVRRRLKSSAPGADGIYLPQSAVAPLMVGFAMGMAPVESIGGNSDRRAVVIPFGELAAAASQNKEKQNVVTLRRLSS